MQTTVAMTTPLLKTLETSREYTLAVAEAMPGQHYDTKPAGAGWNFRELLQHIAYGIGWWEDNYINGKETDWAPPAEVLNKKQVIASINDAYSKLKETINGSALKADALQGFHSTLDHITHHRAQAVLHLRCQGIEPPAYTY